MGIAERLERELGAGQVLGPADDRLVDYGRDESGLPGYPPECAALCASADEVAAVLALCREAKVPVTPRGAGSGKAGGSIPVAGGVVLSTERMTAIREIDGDDLVCVTEPGAITGDIAAAADAQGLFYPPDPASQAFCSIGGNVACNAGGARAFKYGVTREYVLGLDVALMSGERLRVGRRTAKGVTGYDLVAGFVGSEGTFGVVTEIVLKLLPRPPGVATLLAVYPDLGRAGAAVAAILARGFRPRTLEIMDHLAIAAVDGKTGYRFPRGARAAALIELDGDEEGLEAALVRVGLLCEDAGAVEVVVAQDSAERRALWESRRRVSSELTLSCRHKVSEDICVPKSRLTEMIGRIGALPGQFGIEAACYGHAGDGNVHVNFLIHEDPDDPAVAARIDGAVKQLFRDTLDLGGTLSGEHGIGLTKLEFMPWEQSEAVLEWQRRWKAMWDPDGLLNPGKVLPPRPRTCSE